jgi:hypothetical protein
MNTYLLILYYGMHATSPGAALLNGPFDAAACTELAALGRDPQHVTTCGASNTLSAVLALHRCMLVDVSDGAPELRSYNCQE